MEDINIPEITPSVPVEKKKLKLDTKILFIIVGIIIGAILIIITAQYGLNSKITTTDNCMLGMQQSFIQGAETLIIQIMNESLQCNQIPINYANYSVTLIPIECLRQNQAQVNSQGGK